MKKRMTALAVFVVFVGAGAWWVYTSNQPATAVHALESAVEHDDGNQLLPYLISADGHDLNEQQSEKIVKWLKANPDTLKQTVSDLNAQAADLEKGDIPSIAQGNSSGGKRTFKLTKKDASLPFLARYQLEITPVFAYARAAKDISVAMDEAGVTIKSDAQDNTDDQYAYIIGPLFPGEHTLIAKKKTILGESQKNISFTSQLGEQTSLPINIQTRTVRVTTNLANAHLLYQGKKLPVAFEKQLLGYTAVLKEIPLHSYDLELVAETPFGTLNTKGQLSANDSGIDLEINPGKSPDVRNALKAFFLGYNKAWVSYAETKSSLAPLDKYLAPTSRARDSYVQELADYQRAAPEFKELFVGRLEAVAIDFGSLQITGDKTISISVKETFRDQWKQVSTGQTKDNGKEELYWSYQLQMTNGKWQILDNIELPTWSWSDKISDVDETKL